MKRAFPNFWKIKMSNMTNPFQKSGFIRQIAAWFLDILISASFCIFLIGMLGFIIPLDSQIHKYLLFPEILIPLASLFTLPVLFNKSPGFFLLRIKFVNEKSLTKPSLKQFFAFLTGFLTDSTIEKIFLIIDDKNKVSALKRLTTAFLIIIVLFCGVTFTLGLSSKNTGLYKTSVDFASANRVGELDYGSPARLGFIPKEVAMNGDTGEVVVSSTWPKKSGFISFDLNRENDIWKVNTIKILDKKVPRRYSFHYRSDIPQPKVIKSIGIGLLVFIVIWITAFGVLISELYLLIKIRNLRKKASVEQSAPIKRRLTVFFVVFVALWLLLFIVAHFM